MKNEIYEIPYRAELCYLKNKGVILPENVPYIGMGSSYYASLVFKYLGVKIFPEIGSEYYHFLIQNSNPENAVLVSQSGGSSEILWCSEHLSSFVALVNDTDSPLANKVNCSRIISLFAGDEKLIPAKTYINTLITLYLGFGFDPGAVIPILKNKISVFKEYGMQMGEFIYKQIRRKKSKGIYVLGNGPNIATAYQAALVLSETTRMPFLSMSVAQYDHGHKETAPKSMVIVINPPDSPLYKRTKALLKKIKNAGAEVYELSQAETEEKFSPLTFPFSFFFAAEWLADRMRIENPFEIGEKVTRTDLKQR